MKLLYVTRIFLVLALLTAGLTLKAQQNDELLNLLIKKNVLTQKEADSLRADLALKQQLKKDKENVHGITIGSRALQLSGLVQVRYQGFEQTGVNDAFDLHRIRLDVRGDVTDKWSYDIYTEYGGTSVKLVDAWTAYKFEDYLKITAGQFKIPFSVGRLTLLMQLSFSELF